MALAGYLSEAVRYGVHMPDGRYAPSFFDRCYNQGVSLLGLFDTEHLSLAVLLNRNTCFTYLGSLDADLPKSTMHM